MSRCFQAWRKDATGNALAFTDDDPYGGGANTRLIRVTAADGAEFPLAYDDPNDLFRITRVLGPDGRVARFPGGPECAGPSPTRAGALIPPRPTFSFALAPGARRLQAQAGSPISRRRMHRLRSVHPHLP